VPRTAARTAGFARTTTEKRFIAAFGAVVLVVGAAAYMTLAGLGELHDIMHRSVSASRELILTHRLESGIHQTYAHQAHTIILGDTSHLERYEAANSRLKTKIEHARASAPERRYEIDAVEQARAESEAAFRERLLPAVLAGDLATVHQEHDRLLARIEAVERVLDAEAGRLERQLVAFDDHGSAIAHSGFRNALLMLVGVAVFTAIVGVALGRSVALPIAHLHAGARRIAEGDLSAELPVTGPPEFRALAVQFNEMVVATRENQARLLESERLAGIGQLAAGVAHEINNPLGVIRGYTRLLAKRATDAQEQADLQVIEDECLRCHEIVRGLLDLSRPPVHDATDNSLGELVAEVVERMDHSEPGSGSRVVIHGSGIAWANARTLRQILVNLLDNALQADPDGTIEVRIRDQGNLVAVEVVDHGAGLPTDEGNRLFEPFFTTKATGTGLGLAVSRAIARAHGGDLEARDAGGGGAVFTLTLPSSQPEHQA
jgi:signal transduction histidine kinase